MTDITTTDTDRKPFPTNEFRVTLFGSVQARSKDELTFTMQTLAQLIAQTQAEYKASLPLLKLAQFGNLTTTKGSLRHDANVNAVTGCEADYDREQITFDQAVEALTYAGVAAIVYTSPSHEPDRPRWRVLAPFSTRQKPQERDRFMRRLNGVLNGAVGDESFTLSQSYYYGHLIEAAEWRVQMVEGRCIDLLDNLDASAIGKSGTQPKQGGNGPDPEFQVIDLNEMMRRFMTGESLHPSILRIVGKWARDSVPRDTAIAFVAQMFGAANQQRYAGRWNEMLRVIDWVYDKEGAQKPQPQPPGPLPFLNLNEWAGVPPPPQEWTIRDLVPRNNVTLFSGEGAAGKSTLGLHLAASHALGRPWLNFDPAPGPAMFIDCEDTADVIHRRLDAVLALNEAGFADLVPNLKVLSMAGQDALMASATRGGKVEPTGFYRSVLEAAKSIRPQTIVISSLANVYAGSEIDRSQVNQFVLGLMVGLARAANGSVILISHPSLTGISTGTGLSGSTHWHNAARARMYLTSPKKNGKDDEPPASDLRLLEFKKNQYGPPAASITLRYRNGLFLPENTGISDFQKAALERRSVEVFRALLRRFLDVQRNVSDNAMARNYAPTVFAKEAEAIDAKIDKPMLEQAMRTLFREQSIKVSTYGKPSRGWSRIEFQ